MAEQLSHGRAEDKICLALPIIEGRKRFDFLQHSDFKDLLHIVGKPVRVREIVKLKEDETCVVEHSE